MLSLDLNPPCGKREKKTKRGETKHLKQERIKKGNQKNSKSKGEGGEGS